LQIEFNDRRLEVEPGLNVAAALLSAGITDLRTSPSGQPRGAFCMMGVCQECVVTIDGSIRQACLVRVEDGMTIATGQRI
jgi:predicted molibdopterin-dependent oxidoreductase YjgC